ncbi:1-deoxy-D-xylulose 5-phosphate reductoisomerase [hydrothermal vent metagenome]|uniref:1-deoxy-D-xylulose-5-phosphate reductoisomerase n=1 Tax=hydrothermal vent metagenome TaxID=652676 RepID=A0A3B0ZGL1_9ZZZZ
MTGITVLGSTGSIGVSTLDVIAQHPEQYRAVALTANRNVERLFAQCVAHCPDYAVMCDETAAEQLQQKIQKAGLDVEVLAGTAGLEKVSVLPQCDQVMAAIVGAAGLLPTLAAVQAGKRVLLANKEALVMSGHLFMDAVREHGAELLPIDSEHNAIFQCMPESKGGRFNGLENGGIEQILLTGSGGPFRTVDPAELVNVTPDQACAHPNWVMGRKISVDSATMMNKGLELIEACWLFAAPPEKILIVVHPQSIIHSMVEYIDGSVLAQMGSPDMRIPIAHSMAWPQRMSSGVERLNLFDVARLDFERPDDARFPCLRLARTVAEQGGTAAAILNAANEIAVEAFLDETLGFMDISQVIEATLADVSAHTADSLAIVLQADAAAREVAKSHVERLKLT